MAQRPPMYLFTGSEELLLRRAAERLITELREEGPVEVVDLRAGELREQGLPDLRTGSLFGDRRAVLVRDAQELPGDIATGLAGELDGAPPDAMVILLASGTGRIMKLAKKIKAAGGRVDVAPPRDWEDRKWEGLVREEFAQHKRRASAGAVTAILSHAGLDVSQIAEKVSQVVAASSGTVDEAAVERAVVGHGSRGSFAVADAMCAREPARALELLRGVLESGNDPIMVLGALVYRVRSIIAVAGRIDAKDVGLRVSAGQARHLNAARRNFGPGELTRAVRTLADADVEMKSGELPAELVIERAVVSIATPA